jgi:hypothetical protein
MTCKSHPPACAHATLARTEDQVVKKTTKRYPMRTIKEPAFPAGPRAKEIQAMATEMVARALKRQRREMAMLAAGRSSVIGAKIRINGTTYVVNKTALGKVSVRVSQKAETDKSATKKLRQKNQHGAIASPKHAER